MKRSTYTHDVPDYKYGDPETIILSGVKYSKWFWQKDFKIEEVLLKFKVEEMQEIDWDYSFHGTFDDSDITWKTVYAYKIVGEV